MKIDFNFAPDTKVTLAANGQTESVDLWSRAHKLFEGHAGRVNVYDAAMSSPSAGRTVLRSDGQTTVDLLDQTGPVEVSVALGNDRTGVIRAAPRAQQRGMHSGLFYWLAQEADGRFRIEPGRRHRKVYVSASAQAMTKAAIAAHAGVTETTVTAAWLAARPQYGGSVAMPIAMDAFNLLKNALWGGAKDGRSDWVMLERGYSYNIEWPANIKGESELHPIVVDAWGTGSRPHLATGAQWIKPGPRFMVWRNLQIRKAQPWYSYGTIFENCRMSEEENDLSRSGMITLREVGFHDIYRHTVEPAGATEWASHLNRKSGLYAAEFYNLMIDGCLCDMNGWKEGYDHARAATMPHPPSMYSHGFYLQYGSQGVHVRDSLFSRNASQGLQNRSGGQFERNLFLDNNIAAGLHSGTNLGPIHQFNNAIDLVAYGAGYKRVNDSEGGFDWGFDISGKMTGQIGCIVAHLADPENLTEVSTRITSRTPYNTNTLFSGNDCQVFNWVGKPNERVEGLDTTVLQQTTIQRFAGTKLGVARAALPDFVAYMRDAADGNSIGRTVREAVQWTKARFGQPILERTTPADLFFRPDPRTDGFRWDNRLNWSTGDLPGLNVADSVDLDGHSPLFGTLDCDIASLTSGGGTLDVTSGRLALGGLGDGLDATVRLSGQLWLGATSQPVTIRANGGRLALTGTVSNLALEARGNAEVLLGPDATVPAGKALVVSGQRVMAGWDGTGTATLTVAGMLEFRAGIAVATAGADWSQQVMDMGRRIQTATAQATIADYENRGSNTLNRTWLTDLTGTPQAGETFVYGIGLTANNTTNLDVEKIATVGAILSAGIPMLRVFRSGAIGDGLAEPTVTVSVVLATGSQVVIGRADLLAPGTYDLTGPGVTVTDQGAILPAGVTVTAGKLVLVL
ncbi:hypothetical protein EYE42_12255 [Paracoccus subflavus]|uniref:Uncharacterized protein n=1 Tax=Paracoccus subflavus TaxID=2528244 RepID=A0A4Q9G0W2_9RHOB|nr:hypothetical protein [Paracoccus subflavus]TBN38659.1 hypothetical protein EYE42_12255 [Paracoccus subflavus]